MSWTLLATVALTWPLVAVYAWVAHVLWRRATTADRHAILLFCLFWLGMGAYGAAESLWVVAYVLGAQDLPLALTVLHIKILGSSIGSFGLVSYLAYVLTGKRGVVIAVAAAYVALYLTLETFYAWRGPYAQHAVTWGIRLDYARDAGPLWDAILILLFVPPLVGAIAYATLLRLAPDAEAKWRILWTSVSLLGFFTPVLIGWRAGDLPWWGLVEKLLGLALAGGVILAFRPPRSVRSAWSRRPRPPRVRPATPSVEERIRDLA